MGKPMFGLPSDKNPRRWAALIFSTHWWYDQGDPMLISVNIDLQIKQHGVLEQLLPPTSLRDRLLYPSMASSDRGCTGLR
jgi:hypothetical protein